MVTLSCSEFSEDFDGKVVTRNKQSFGEEDERSVADLLVEQVEFADLIVVSKTISFKTDLKRLM